MNKSEIIKWLEAKRDKRVYEIQEEEGERLNENQDKYVKKYHLVELVNDIFNKADELQKIITDFNKEVPESDMIRERYSGVAWRVQILSGLSKHELMHEILSKDLYSDIGESKAIRSRYTELVSQVCTEYYNLIATCKTMRAKDAIMYLKEVGFDTSELEKPVEKQVTALAVQVNKNLLFGEEK